MSETAGVMLASSVAEEGRSALASLITQLLNTVRTVIMYVLEMAKTFFTWAGEHPLSAVLAVSNVVIWIS